MSETTSASTTRVSISSDQVQGNSYSYWPSISANGRYVAFASDASNLVAGDTNGLNNADVFVHDVSTGVTTSVSSGYEPSGHPSISDSGRYIAFSRFAVNGQGSDQVLMRDAGTGATTYLSVSSNGALGNAGSHSPCISPDGGHVAFTSGASNLVAGDTNGFGDVFVRDMSTGFTTRASVSSDGMQGNSGSGGIGSNAISTDGRYVAFTSGASNLVAGDTNGFGDVFVRDMSTGFTTLASVSSGGAQGDSSSGDDIFSGPSISADGRFVAFTSYASNLVAGDINGTQDVFVHDMSTGATTLASVSSDGMQGNDRSGGNSGPSISDDGRHVAFWSSASNLVTGQTDEQHRDVFLHDLRTGATTRVSVSSDGTQGDNNSGYTADFYDPSVSGDGRYVAFSSEASNLVADDTNGVDDVFVRDLGSSQPPPPTRYIALGDSVTYGHGLANPGTSQQGSSPGCLPNKDGVKCGPNQGPANDIAHLKAAYPSWLAQGLGLSLKVRSTGCGEGYQHGASTGSLTGDQLSVSGAPSSSANALKPDDSTVTTDDDCPDATFVDPTTGLAIAYSTKTHKAIDPEELQASGIAIDASDPPALVTILAGANDINFDSCLAYEVAALAWFAGGANCLKSDTEVTDAVRAKLDQLKTSLKFIIQYVEDRAPEATIAVMDYYQAIPHWKTKVFKGSQICDRVYNGGRWAYDYHKDGRKKLYKRAETLRKELNKTIHSVIDVRPEIVKVSLAEAFEGREMCTGSSVSEVFDAPIWRTAHPTADGQIAIFGAARKVLQHCAIGSSFTAEYFGNRDLLGSPVTTQKEPCINKNWGNGIAPAIGVGYKNYSVRWTGEVNFTANRRYAITARADDGIRVWLDGTRIINEWSDHPATSYSWKGMVSTGRHAITVEYYQHEGDAVAKVSWTPSSD